MDDSEQPADTEAWCTPATRAITGGTAPNARRAGGTALARASSTGSLRADASSPSACVAPVAARCPAAGHDVTGIDLCVGPDRPRDGRRRIRRRCGESSGG